MEVSVGTEAVSQPMGNCISEKSCFGSESKEEYTVFQLGSLPKPEI
jgi:hypothetical protein